MIHLILCEKTLEKLRMIINGDETEDYKTGSKLVDFLIGSVLTILMGKVFRLGGTIRIANWQKLTGVLN